MDYRELIQKSGLLEKAEDIEEIEDIKKAEDIEEIEDIKKAEDMEEIEDIKKAEDIEEIEEKVKEISDIRKKKNKVDLEEKEVIEANESEKSEIFTKVRSCIMKDRETFDKMISEKVKNKEKIIQLIKKEMAKIKGADIITAEEIYQNIFSFSFLDNLLELDNLEEINGNAYNDIEIVTSEGTVKSIKTFLSPEHAINTIKQMTKLGNKILDDTSPSVDSYIGKGLRITAMIPPIVDKEVGVSFSLRKIEQNKINIKDLKGKYDSYSEEEIDFLIDCLSHGISVIFGGATGSGKTADLQAICLEAIKKNDLRIYTQEEDTRELNFIVKNGKGKVSSRVVHTRTRPTKNNKDNIDSGHLLKKALRFHPDVIVPAEMRGGEAFVAQEAARTGHTVTSSVHVSSVTEAYKRIMTLCQMSDTNLSEDMLMELIVDAFPVCVFKKQLEDRSRRCLKIFEATGYDKKEKKLKGRILYKFYRIESSKDENGKIIKIDGLHKKEKNISLKLCQKLFDNGLDLEIINEKYNQDYFPFSGDADYIEDYIEDEKMNIEDKIAKEKREKREKKERRNAIGS